jgi:CBS domain-containing protein
MRTTTVGDIMTRNVITVGPTMPFKEIVDRLISAGISALPVIDKHGAVLGVVSEADLLRREEHQDDAPTAHPPVFAGHRTHEQWRKAAGLTAADVMTSPALTVSTGTGLPQVARRLAQAGVRRLVVVDDGKLVGVVARRDLLRIFLRGDPDIKAEIDRDVLAGALHANMTMVRATVEDGVVLLTGRLEYEADVATAARLCHDIPGVVSVRNRLDYLWNGAGKHPAASA